MGISLTIPFGKRGLREIVPKGEGEKMWIENNIPVHSGHPLLKKGEFLLLSPLVKGD